MVCDCLKRYWYGSASSQVSQEPTPHAPTTPSSQPIRTPRSRPPHSREPSASHNMLSLEQIRQKVSSVANVIKEKDILAFDNGHVHALSAEYHLKGQSRKGMNFRYLVEKIASPLFKKACNSAFILDGGLSIVAANQSAFTLLRKAPKHLLATSFRNIFGNDDIEKLKTDRPLPFLSQITLLPTRSQDEKAQAIALSVFRIPYEEYNLLILNTFIKTEPLLLEQSRELQEEYEQVIKGQVVTHQEGSIHCYKEDFDHPTKTTFKKLVISLNHPTYNKENEFAFLCDMLNDWHVVAMNDRAIDITQFYADEVLHKKTLVDCVEKDKQALQNYLSGVQKVMEKDQVCPSFDAQFLVQDANPIPMKIRVHTIKDQYPDCPYAIVIVSKIQSSAALSILVESVKDPFLEKKGEDKPEATLSQEGMLLSPLPTPFQSPSSSSSGASRFSYGQSLKSQSASPMPSSRSPTIDSLEIVPPGAVEEV